MQAFNFSSRENVLALGVLFCILVHALVNLVQPFSGDYAFNYALVSVIIGVGIGILADRLIISRPSGVFVSCVLMALLFSAGASLESFFLLMFSSILFGAIAGFLAKRNVTSCSTGIFLGGIVIGGTAFLIQEAFTGYYVYDQLLLGFVSGCAVGGIMGGVVSLVSESLRCKSLSFQRVLTDKLLVVVAALSLTVRIFLDLRYVGYDPLFFFQIFLEAAAEILSAGFIGVFAGVVVAVLIDRKFIAVPFGVFASMFFVGGLLGFSLFLEGYDAFFVLGEIFAACLVGIVIGFLVDRGVSSFRLGAFAGSVLIGAGLALSNYYFSGLETQNYALLSSSLAQMFSASLMGAGISSAFLFCKRSKRAKR